MRRRAIRQSALLYGGIGVFVLMLTNRGDFSRAGLVGLAVGGSVTLVLITLLIWSGVRALPKEWDSYALLVGDDTLTWRHYRLGEAIIRRNEVTQIEEFPTNGLMVKTVDSKRIIFIKTALEEYDTVRTLLTSWMPLTPKLGLQGAMARYGLAFAIPALLFAGILLFDNVLAVVLSGAMFVGAWLWSLNQMRRHGRLRGRLLVCMLVASLLLVYMIISRLSRVMAL